MSEYSPALTIESADASSPTSEAERIKIVDIVRGFAVFGILVVNMAWFNSPVYLYVMDVHWWTGTADRITTWFIRFFAEGKFYSLFSFLFGLGLTLQVTRAEARNARFAPLYRRRLSFLLLIGLVHGFLVWAGDILAAYALLGFLLLLFRNRKPKTLLIWAIICLSIPVLLTGLGVVALELGRSFPQSSQQIEASFAQSAEGYRELTEQSLRNYSQGSFADIMTQRIKDLGFMYFALVFIGPNIFALFLFGMYVGKRGYFQDIVAHLPLVRRAIWYGLVFGLVGNAVYVIAREYSNPAVPTLMSFVSSAAFFVGGPALCIFYLSSLIMLAQNQVWMKRLSPLAAVGRTAVSNYLFQSLICTTIFYSYGFSLYGKVGPALGVVFTVAIFILQLYLSRWWLQRFRFGPVEWLWRSFTYRKVQPMRLARPTAGSI